MTQSSGDPGTCACDLTTLFPLRWERRRLWRRAEFMCSSARAPAVWVFLLTALWRYSRAGLSLLSSSTFTHSSTRSQRNQLQWIKKGLFIRSIHIHFKGSEYQRWIGLLFLIHFTLILLDSSLIPAFKHDSFIRDLNAPAPLFVFNSDPRGFKDFTPIVPTEKTQNLRQEEAGEI